MPTTSGELTTKQQRFVEEYVVDFNATQAAIRAGYAENSARQQGSRLLSNADICRAVAALTDGIAAEVGVSVGYVLRRLRDAAEVNYPKYVIEEDHRGRPVGIVLGNATASIRALELLGKHLAMFTDRLEVTQITKDALQAEIERLESELADA